MRKVLTTIVTLFVLAIGTSTLASAKTELVMIDLNTCTFCAKFRAEVAPIYSGTDAGHIAPLRRVSPLKRWPEDLAGIRKAPYTPVFILVENGREVGRFAGYTNMESFFSQLKPLLGRL